MQNAKAIECDLKRAEYLRRNLRRIFDVWGVQAKVAQDAGIQRTHLAAILSEKADNPTIGTIEALSIALEISVETLLSPNPSDADLRISIENLSNRA